MGFMQMGHMSKYIVWTSDNTGEYVRADEAIQSSETVSFVQHTPTVDIEVRKFKLKDIKDYHKVE